MDRVWLRMTAQFPHTFAVAEARGLLSTVPSTGQERAARPQSVVTRLTLHGWTLSPHDLDTFARSGHMAVPVFELFSRMLLASFKHTHANAPLRAYVAN
eukprot:14795723-Heterocapsa_arctica.AAC.1